ncbi:conserved membrane hypothetical protein [Planktothrix sp. PCC 11201]|uniref:hypothetical protein n=1 Tax=Planktothrix sp. PCC 11201 TaxID=1729650 RepID=UPI0009202939|nr:hypothetical protein [Planktothrix sp. PCC 11201]SKB12594.1 conserved membrane hypothetical protein [Planktothrix sp. PCC 11201]
MKILALDLISAIWLYTLWAILFLGLPYKSFSSSYHHHWHSKIVSAFARTSLVVTVGVFALTAFHLFSWLTLVLFYTILLLIVWYYRQRKTAREKLTIFVQGLLFLFLDILDQGLPTEQIFKSFSLIYQQYQKRLLMIIGVQTINSPQKTLKILVLTVILSFTLLLRFEHPLLEMRLATPDSYQNLLLTQQFLTGDWDKIQHQVQYLPVFSVLTAVMSLLASVDSAQVIRFLQPLFGFLLVLSVGYSLQTLTQKGTVAWVGMFSLGAYLFTWSPEISKQLPLWGQQVLGTVIGSLNFSLVRQWAVGDEEIAAMFLVLSLACFTRVHIRKLRPTAVLDTCCCLAMVAMAAPVLLILALIGIVGVMGSRILGLASVAISWLLLALLFAFSPEKFDFFRVFLITLPVGLSLLIALVFLFISWLLFPILRRNSEIACLILLFCFACNFLLPPPAKINYLEYEVAARKSLEIRTTFPLKRWIIVAPPEQLAQNYRAGWHEDLAEFVKQYLTEVKFDDFQFPYEVPDLFVFVEKQPLAIYPLNLHLAISNSILLDPTYHYYRSLAGRTSLEFEALKLCELYQKHHAGASIYYEDDQLKICHFEL